MGTEDELKERADKAKSLQALILDRTRLEPLIMSQSDLQNWGYMVDIPQNEGGHVPHMEGQVVKCERCSQPFQVCRTGSDTECLYHWGKQHTIKASGRSSPPSYTAPLTCTGEKVRVYTCCSRPVSEGEGCVHGRHVFYESSLDDLHSRHAFSLLRPPGDSDDALDIAAMDCEMVYTTGGFRVARVSLVDGKGKVVFDELIQMDEGVYVT